MSASIVQSRYPDLDALSARFAQQGEQVQTVTRRVAQRAEVLRSGSWQGRGKAAFLAELDGEVTPALLRLATALEQAGQVTAQIRLLILAAEEDAAAPFRGDISGESGAESGGSGTGESGGALGGDEPVYRVTPFDLSAALIAAGPILSKMLDIIGELSERRGAISGVLRNSGLGKLFHLLIVKGIPENGLVGKLLNSGKFAYGLAFVDTYFGVIDDLSHRTYGDDWAKAIGVNVLDGGVQLGIASTQVGAAVIIANALHQGIGVLEAGTMRLNADFLAANDVMNLRLLDDARSMELAYKKMDLTNITKALGEAIWDGYGELLTPHGNMAKAYLDGFNRIQQDPSLVTMSDVMTEISRAGRDNLPGMLTSTVKMTFPATGWIATEAGVKGIDKTILEVGKVVDGFIDANTIRISNATNMTVNNTIVQSRYLPIPDGMKQSISDAAMEIARASQLARRTLNNLIEF